MAVGVDSYVTIAEADLFFSAQFPPLHPLRVHWEVLTDPEKEVYLSRACERLEGLNYRGRRYRADQPLKFPRIAYGKPSRGDKIPTEVKRAQVLMTAECMREEYAEMVPEMTLTALGAERPKYDKSAVPDVVKDILRDWYTRMRRF